MKIRMILLLLVFLPVCADGSKKQNIGLLIMATGRYIEFVKPLIDSANKHFCTDHKITYFIFTDGEPPKADNIIKIEQKRLGWPDDTLMRLSVYHKHRRLLAKMDYLFATDADMLFVDTVGDEILSARVATQHPGFVGRRGTYETREISTAFVEKTEGKHYFAGGFNGGAASEFLKMAEIITKNIMKDKGNGLIAIWHDESHLNRYFIDNPPTKILDPSYCYPESWKLPFKKRLLALDKNHSELRKK